MRALFYTDIHISGQTPVHRIDDYPQTMLGKLAEVYRMAESEGVDVVLYGGDLFDTHKVYSYPILTRVIDTIGSSHCPTYAIAGQHDLRGYSASTLPGSALAFVERYCESLHVITRPVSIGGAFLIPCSPWEDVTEVVASAPSKKRLPLVMIAHELLSRDMHAFEVVKTSSLPSSDIDLVLSGDLHSGYPVHEVDGTVFCNPGALARKNINEAAREPTVAVVDFRTKEVRLIRLPGARPGEEVFGTTLAEELREGAAFDARKFAADMEGLKDHDVDIFDLIPGAAKKAGLSAEVVDYILSKRPDDEKKRKK